MPILPEVASPERKTPFRQRLMWTGVGFLPNIRLRDDSATDADCKVVDTTHFLGYEPNAVSAWLLTTTLEV